MSRATRASTTILLSASLACAAGGPGSGEPAARITSASAKADGDEGAAYWDVYVDGDTMTWVGRDASGTREDRLFFHSDADAIWLDVDRDGLPLATLGLAMSGDLLAMPEAPVLDEVALLLDEAFRDSDAAALEASKEDGADAPRGCLEERDLTFGQVLRVCAASFGAIWRLSTGRYEETGIFAVFAVFADLITPYACTGGLASVAGVTGSLSDYCDNPGRLRVESATMTCRSTGSAICDLSVQISGEGNLPGEVVDHEWPRVEVFGPTGRSVGWGFAEKGTGATWSDRVDVWDVDPNATYRVVVTSDLLVTAETTVRITR